MTPFVLPDHPDGGEPAVRRLTLPTEGSIAARTPRAAWPAWLAAAAPLTRGDFETVSGGPGLVRGLPVAVQAYGESDNWVWLLRLGRPPEGRRP